MYFLQELTKHIQTVSKALKKRFEINIIDKDCKILIVEKICLGLILALV